MLPVLVGRKLKACNPKYDQELVDSKKKRFVNCWKELVDSKKKRFVNCWRREDLK